MALSAHDPNSSLPHRCAALHEYRPCTGRHRAVSGFAWRNPRCEHPGKLVALDCWLSRDHCLEESMWDSWFFRFLGDWRLSLERPGRVCLRPPNGFAAPLSSLTIPLCLRNYIIPIVLMWIRQHAFLEFPCFSLSEDDQDSSQVAIRTNSVDMVALNVCLQVEAMLGSRPSGRRGRSLE